MNTTERANGRWPEILKSLGVDESFLTGKNTPCPLPGCGGKDRFRFDDNQGFGTYYCNQCGPGNGFEFVKNWIGCEFQEAAQRVETILLGGQPPQRQKVVKKQPDEYQRDLSAGRFNESILRGCQKIKPGDSVSQYLKNRGLDIASDALLYAPKIWDTDTEKAYPGMVIKIYSPAGEVISLHRTFLQDNKKADIPSPRKITKGIISTKGGAIRLYKATDTLSIAEGIESALAVRQGFAPGVPVWSVMNADGMRSFQPPDGLKKLGIYCDNDINFVGQFAAYDLAARLIRDGLIEKGNIAVYCPKFGGHDFLDELIYNKSIQL